MGMKIWEEAFFCLSQDPTVVQDYFKWKHENAGFDPEREGKEYQKFFEQQTLHYLNSKLNEFYRRKSCGYNPSYAQLSKYEWFSDPQVSRNHFMIELLKEEIGKRPPQSKKEIRQERAKQNRSHGRCKNR